MQFEIEKISGEASHLPVELIRADVQDDRQAIQIYLDSYCRRSTHTVRSYAKECWRFHLWLNATKGIHPTLLPTVSVADINQYLEFLGTPRPFSEAFMQKFGWDHQPFRKPLSTESIKHAIAVLHKMFNALRNVRNERDEPYCRFNPVELVQDGIAGSEQVDEIEEALTLEEWEAVQEAIEQLPQETDQERKQYHRARWCMNLLYRSFLRREEAANLVMGDFEPSTDGWNLRTIGKGHKKAKIIATTALMEELKTYRTSLGLSPLPSLGETRPAIMAVRGKDKGITAQAIYLLCKEIFARAADLVEARNPYSAHRLRQASPHWMRHTGVSHAMDSGVDPRYVQAQARHSSLTITAKYDHKRKKAWRDHLEKM